MRRCSNAAWAVPGAAAAPSTLVPGLLLLVLLLPLEVSGRAFSLIRCSVVFLRCMMVPGKQHQWVVTCKDTHPFQVQEDPRVVEWSEQHA
jgi:hypothetical protein